MRQPGCGRANTRRNSKRKQAVPSSNALCVESPISIMKDNICLYYGSIQESQWNQCTCSIQVFPKIYKYTDSRVRTWARIMGIWILHEKLRIKDIPDSCGWWRDHFVHVLPFGQRIRSVWTIADICLIRFKAIFPFFWPILRIELLNKEVKLTDKKQIAYIFHELTFIHSVTRICITQSLCYSLSLNFRYSYHYCL